MATSYTPYQLVYGLHLLMPTKYILPAINGDNINAKPTKVLIAKITKLEKLLKNILEAQTKVGENQWNRFMWSQQKNT